MEGITHKLRLFITLTKPRQLALLMLTMYGAYFAAGGSADLYSLALLTVMGFSSIGGVTALNMYFDADIDYVMRRTRKRPLPSRKLSPGEALAGSVALIALGAVTAYMINPYVLATVLAGLFFDIVAYTQLTKRFTPLSIVSGSVAGSMPALGGWAAGAGAVTLGGVLLALLVFLWQPAHVALLNYYYREDYLSAGIRVLTERNPERSLKVALIASPLLLALAMWVFAYLEGMGYIGAIALSLLAVRIMREAERIRTRPGRGQLVTLFKNVGILIAVPYTLVPLETLIAKPFYLALASLLG